MKVFYYICFAIWTAYLITFSAGFFNPDEFTIGVAFFVSALYFLGNALEAN